MIWFEYDLSQRMFMKFDFGPQCGIYMRYGKVEGNWILGTPLT
jgi:hypothetical protein